MSNDAVRPEIDVLLAGAGILDTTPPNPPAVSGITPTHNTKPTWTWVSGGGDGNGTYRYQLGEYGDMAPETAETNYTPVSALSAGSHTLYVQERDAAGNWSASGSKAIVVDVTPPDTTITGKPNNPSTSNGANFSFTSTEGNSPFQCQLDGGSYEACTSPKAYTGLKDESHTFNVTATDQAGNTDTTPATCYTWFVNTDYSLSCTDSGIPCVERVGGGSDSDNFEGGKPKADVEYEFRVTVKDTLGTPEYVKLFLTQRYSPGSGEFTGFTMNCTGSFSTGATCTFTTKLGPAAVHKFYFEAKSSDGETVKYPESD